MDRKIPSGQVLRKWVQGLSGLLQNAHLTGFVTGRLYKGPLKRFCVPGMNCYSCPGALGACPIGALQAVLGERKARFPFYVLGYLTMIGALLGRFVCGWLCLFGLVQELLCLVPVRKVRVPEKADRILRGAKYLLLFLAVLLLPVLVRDRFGAGTPWFCKILCPVGMLEGGIPLFILDRAIRPAARFLYAWKLGILVLILVLSMVIRRPFCKYLCPLGAFYGLFAKISLVRLDLDRKACVSCGACRRACPMEADPSRKPDSAECIRCGACTGACPEGALSLGLRTGKKRRGEEFPAGKERHGKA